MDPKSSSAIESALNGERSMITSLSGGYCLDSVPTTIRHLFGSADRSVLNDGIETLGEFHESIVLVVLDGFGWSSFERFTDSSPLLQTFLSQGICAKIQSQFPTTTSVNMTTLHTGLRVGETGLFEWTILEPLVGGLICPMMYSYAGDRERDTLKARFPDPAQLLPNRSIYRELSQQGVSCTVHQSKVFTPSTYSDITLGGAHLAPFKSCREILGNALGAPSSERCYSVIYINEADAVAHIKGPASSEYSDAVMNVLGMLNELFLALPSGTLFMLTADHGHVDMDPRKTIMLNKLWPGIESYLKRWECGPPIGPAGSPRDCFLYLQDGVDAEDIVEELRRRLHGAAQVTTSESLVESGIFGLVGSRFRERIGDIVVLPGIDQTVWWSADRGFDNFFLGHHGGLSEAESVVPYASVIR